METILLLKIMAINILAIGMGMLSMWAFEKDDERKQKNINLMLRYMLVSTVGLGFAILVKMLF